MTRPVLGLSAAQLVRNVDVVRAHIAPSELMLTMKDDAYGHGLEWVLGALDDDRSTTRFGSFDIDTGLRIRALRPAARIFAWTTSDDDEIDAALRAELELGIGTPDYLRRVIAAAQRSHIIAKVHLKIDTGLHRNGIRPEDWAVFVDAVAAAQRTGALEVVGVWSHLAEASDAEDDAAAAVFRAAIESLRMRGFGGLETHLTASAASWWRPELRGTLSRVGAFCYGIRSAEGPAIPGIRPIAALRAEVTGIQGDRAEIAVGALHGLPSTISGVDIGTPAGPRRLLDVGDHHSLVAGWDGAALGEQVTIFGPGDQGESDATSLAEHVGTVGEEILTRLTPRVHRVAQ